MTARRGPILIEENADTAQSSPADAPPVPDAVARAPDGQAMRTMAALADDRPLRVQLRLQGAPAGCELQQPKTIESPLKRVELQLAAQPDTPPGEYPDLRLMADVDAQATALAPEVA